ncbi:hypothetical protein, partial [Streptomyces aurantiacus]|uniref:hypothetical protein n=1 Tax=Streptomyces aurantiacus TaxID=47760 RepID=UPI0037D9A364
MQAARTAGDQRPGASPETPAQPSAERRRKRPSLRPTPSDIALLTVLIVLNVVVAVWNETHHEGHPRFGPWA